MMSSRMAMLAALAVTAACEPCAGVVGCTVSPHVSLTGRVLHEVSGRPVSGIPVDFVRTGGLVLDLDSARVVTSEDGSFTFELAAESEGIVEGYVRVWPRDSMPYRVTGLDLATSIRRGEAQVFRAWSTVPHLPDLTEVYIRGSPALTAAGARVDFRQTGGVAVRGLGPTEFTRTADARGWVPLFGNELRPVDAGEVVGDVTVHMPAPIGTITRTGVRIRATPDFRPGLSVHRLGVGPSLEYHIVVNRRGVPEAVAGVQVEFTRTGGVPVTAPHWAAVTNADGRVAIRTRALGSGTLVGTLRIAPPAPWRPFERTAVEFNTFDEDGARLYEVMEVGPGFGAYAVFRAGGAGVKGVEVAYTRVGGLPARPSAFTAVSNDSGYALLTAATEGEGEVVLELRVRPPPPHRSFTVRNVRVQAHDGDRPAQPLIAGTFDVASPPAARVP